MSGHTRHRKGRPKETDLESHLIEQRVADAQWMLAQGEHISRVAKRLGVSVSALEKNLGRDAKQGSSA